MTDNKSLFSSTLSIDYIEGVSDERMLQIIEQRVTELMSQSPDLLFSYLYRLDISEKKIKQGLYESDGMSPNLAIARLILERQKQRIASKKKYKQDPPIEGWEF